MVELAEIFRRHGPEYRAKYRGRLLPSHQKSMRDIELCRTPAFGGEVYWCKKCLDWRYSYHSCQNRHCPKCQNNQAEEWLEKQRAFLLPVVYFLVTFTLPKELRRLARGLQKVIYRLFFRVAAASLQELAQDPKYVGGLLGMIGLLHTWAKNMTYHLHLHFLVPGGGLSPDGTTWLSSRKNFLVPKKALSIIFKAKFKDELKKVGLFHLVPEIAWEKRWGIHIKPVGSGERALIYLANYVFRVAISNKRIEKLEDGQVTYRYKDNFGLWHHLTVLAEEFIRRFLQHVLPRGFQKVRYYGLFSARNRLLLQKARKLLLAKDDQNTKAKCLPPQNDTKTCLCPKCGQPMTLVETLKPLKIRSP
jgi:hypothetical protein